jgi:hypothetical protein
LLCDGPGFDLEVAILREADSGPKFPQFDGKLNALPDYRCQGTAL